MQPASARAGFPPVCSRASLSASTCPSSGVPKGHCHLPLLSVNIFLRASFLSSSLLYA